VSYDTADKLTDAYVELLTAMRPLIGAGMSAAVYTQTSDVEIEVNGLMTYDRKLVKMDLDRIAAAAKRLYGPPPTMAVVVPASDVEPQTWRYAVEKPAEGWNEAGFDDSQWKSGPGGFGTRDTPNTTIGTEWNGEDIWIRRTFTLADVPEGDLHLRMYHDEDAEVYLNGQRVAQVEGYVTGYKLLACEGDASKLLREGENTLAVHCRQTGGGQCIDVGLTVIREPDAAAKEEVAAAAR
jgi:hypothetical protein